MAQVFQGVDNERDPVHNVKSFDKRAKELSEETGTYVMSPHEVILNTETGEVTDYNKVVQSEQEYRRKQKADFYLKQKLTSEYAKYGTFFWLVYDPVRKLFPEINTTDVVMLIMLATFSNYDNRLTFKNGKEIFRKDLPRVLDTSKATITRFISRTTSAGLLSVEDDNTIKLNAKAMYRGKLHLKRGRCARIYVDVCQKLYYDSSKENRRRLYYVFGMLPWIHFERNILCKNPDEDDISKIIPMNLLDYAKCVGYDEKNLKRFWNVLMSFSIDNDEPVILMVRGRNEDRASIIVNPKLLCGAKDVETMRVLFETQRTEEKQKTQVNKMYDDLQQET